MRQRIITFGRSVAAGALALTLAGCSLYSDVSIKPLNLKPTDVERGSDAQAMLKKADYLRLYEQASAVSDRSRPSSADLAALGTAELMGGRYDDARRHLRAALDLDPYRTSYSRIAWDLAQVEYLTNNYATSLEWAEDAQEHGLSIRPWHLEYLRAMSNERVYQVSGPTEETVPMRVGRPDVPRVEVRLNDKRNVTAIVDSGAVTSILSERVAASLPVRRLGDITGRFYGLLGEPIAVKFGILESVMIGDMVIENVPVAIMPDENMKFLVSDSREFRMDFLLGANLLKEFRIALDFSALKATFTHLQPADRIPAADQNLFWSGYRPAVRSIVNQRGWYLFILDTGSEVTYLNDQQIINLRINAGAPRLHNATLQGLGGSKKRGAKIENVEIGVDRWVGTFKTLPIYTAADDEVTTGIIGENLLKKFRVVIDFGRMRMDLERR